jgi:hypothetical protein
MRYDPGDQGIQLLHRYLRVLRTALIALEVLAGGTVWSGANRREGCVALVCRVEVELLFIVLAERC